MLILYTLEMFPITEFLLPTPGKTNFTISYTDLWIHVFILNQESWQILSSWCIYGDQHRSFFLKLPVVPDVIQNSWGQEGSPQLSVCLWLTSFTLFSCQTFSPCGFNRGLWPQTWTLGRLSPPRYKENLWGEHEDLIRKCVQEFGRLCTKKCTLILM